MDLIKVLGILSKEFESQKMLERSKKKSLFNGEIVLNILMPEDLIGLKLQALMNDEGRKTRELADIQMIMERFKDTINWSIVKEHFDIFSQQALFLKLKERYG